MEPFWNLNIKCSKHADSMTVELLIDKSDSDGFISRLVVCSSSDSSYNMTDSSLISVGYQLRFLALLCADLACTWLRNCKQSVLVVTLYSNSVAWLYKLATCRLANSYCNAPRVLHYSASYYNSYIGINFHGWKFRDHQVNHENYQYS